MVYPDFVIDISIHSPYTGRDHLLGRCVKEDKKFQSTLPIQGETINGYNLSAEDATFQSTLPIQGETQRYSRGGFLLEISIHSPYTGRDRHFCFQLHSRLYFNPLSLYRERQTGCFLIHLTGVFQSTLPIQGETTFFWTSYRFLEHFNPLSLYRERLSTGEYTEDKEKFQSTLPIQGETEPFIRLSLYSAISIHSPYTGRDILELAVLSFPVIFQSTLPIQGETLYASWNQCLRTFQSTLPIQGETISP